MAKRPKPATTRPGGAKARIETLEDRQLLTITETFSEAISPHQEMRWLVIEENQPAERPGGIAADASNNYLLELYGFTCNTSNIDPKDSEHFLYTLRDHQYKIEFVSSNKNLDSTLISMTGPRLKPSASSSDANLDAGDTSRIDALLASVPLDAAYVDQARQLAELSNRFRQRVASRLLPVLKAEMQIPERPHATLDEKKELVKWVNAELRRFGLAVKHPKTGRAANFMADKGNHPEEGRFQLRSDGGDKVETFSTPKLSVLLDALELIEAPPREEGLANWADRAKQTPPPRSSRR